MDASDEKTWDTNEPFAFAVCFIQKTKSMSLLSENASREFTIPRAVGGRGQVPHNLACARALECGKRAGG